MRKGTKMTPESREKIRLARARQVITKESKLKRSLSMKGKQKPAGFGEKVSRGRAARKAVLGYINSPETRVKIGLAGIGRVCSEESRIKHSESLRGAKSPYWEGGITPLNLAIRRTYKYRQWRSDVFTRDDFSCQECFKKGVYIEADHINPFCLILKKNNIKSVDEALACEELWDINNGRTLCKNCHSKTETYKKKATLFKNKT